MYPSLSQRRAALLRDADDCAGSLQGWRQQYLQLGRGGFRAQVTQMAWHGGSLLRESSDCHVHQRIQVPPGSWVIGLPLTVPSGSLFNQQRFDENSLLLLNSRHEHELLATGPIDMLGICLQMSCIDVPDLCDELSERGKAPATPLVVQRASAAALAQRLQALLGPAHGARMSDGDLWQFVSSEVAALLRKANPPATGTVASPRAQRTLHSAIAFMQQHIDADIDLADICAACHASPSLLLSSFAKLRGCSPHRYLLALRLSHARRVLKQGAQASITELAHAMRFSSSSHFSMQYGAMFGERPSSTLSG